MKKILCLMISVLFLFSSCKNTDKPIDNSSTPEKPPTTSGLSSISIPYVEADSINPFSSYSSINIAVLPLIYDSLVSVNNQFEAECLIAEKIERSSETTITVSIKKDIFFSDGTPLTADDVVFSFNTLKVSRGHFSEKLSEISSVAKSDQDTVVFTLREPSRYGENCLDFPIACKASGTGLPIGSGRYILSYKDKKPVLTANKNHSLYKDFTVNEIGCYPIPDNDSLFLAIKTGNVNIIPSDLSLGTYVGTFCQSETVPTSNLVYLGVSGSGAAAESKIRQYISAAIDRSVIVSAGSLLSSIETSLPLFPKTPEIFRTNLNSTKADSKLLSEIKTDKMFTTEKGGKLHYSGEQVKIRILYSEESSEKKAFAGTISAQLSSVGIDTELVGKSYADFKTSVAAGDYDVYIGETKLMGSLNFSKLLTDAEFGLSATPSLLESYAAFNTYKASAEDFLNTFSSELPFIPIMYKSGSVSFTKSITEKVETSVSDSYKSIQYLK